MPCDSGRLTRRLGTRKTIQSWTSADDGHETASHQAFTPVCAYPTCPCSGPHHTHVPNLEPLILASSPPRHESQRVVWRRCCCPRVAKSHPLRLVFSATHHGVLCAAIQGKMSSLPARAIAGLGLDKGIESQFPSHQGHMPQLAMVLAGNKSHPVVSLASHSAKVVPKKEGVKVKAKVRQERRKSECG